MPLKFDHAPATTRDDLVISDPVTAAVEIIDRWPDWTSPLVILTGPTGAGKSHLSSVWREKAGATAISAGSNDEENAVATASAGPVLFEDADRTGFDERVLFHVINAVRQNATSLLMTTRMWPSAWGVDLPDLRSRLKAATVVEIGEPDDALLSQVVVKLFADRQIVVDDKVVAYLVVRMERSLEAAQRLVERIDELALARGVRVTRALAAEAIGGSSHDDGLDGSTL